MAVQTKILHRRDVAANWTSTNPTLNAGELGFETDTLKFKIGNGSSAWTALTYSQDASLLSGTASITALTTSGNVIVGGDLTVNGTTTSINSSTLQVDDKNIELASVAAIVGRTGTASTSNVTITASNTSGFIIGQSVTRTAGATMTTGTVASIINATAFTVSSAPSSSGSITFDIGGATDVTADGAGLTVLGATNKTFIYDNSTTSWLSNQDLGVATGKVFEINGSTVLSSTQVLGYSITNANTVSTVVARDASGNFSAGTITASLTGTAQFATTANAVAVGNVGGLGTGVATALAVNTGTAGAFVVNGGALGTPSSANLSSATGLPVSTGISGLGTGVATFLATPTSANLISAVTDETGTGNLVFSTSPTLVTPTLGVASATTINKVAFTAPSTGATLALADLSTLTTSGAFSTTFTATGTTTLTLPTSGTLATQAFVGSATVAQANNLTGAANLVPYQSAANTTSFLAFPVANNYVLSANTSGAPFWAAPASTGVTSLVAGNGITVSGATGAVTVNTNTSFATTFTTTQRVNVSSDVVAFAVRANTTQTTNLIEAKDGAGTTTLMSLSNVGTLFAVTIDGGTA